MNPGEMTTGEAEAWRAGWRAAQEAATMAVFMIQTEAAEYDADGPESDVIGRWRAQGEADAASRVHAAIRALQPPERPE